jgi:hypothetical protein
VFKVGNKTKENKYTEIHQDGSYIILTSGTCVEWKTYIRIISKQIIYFINEGYVENSWNPNAKFFVSVMSNCTPFDNKRISKSILKYLWFNHVMNATVLFLKTNEHAGNVLQQNTTDSAQGTYLELHTGYPYENSDRCNPTEGNVPVNVFTVRNFSDISRSNMFRVYIEKNFNGCPIRMYEAENRFMKYLTGQYQPIDIREWTVELLRVIGKALNISLRVSLLEDEKTNPTNKQFILLVPFTTAIFASSSSNEITRTFLSERFVWYTPCAVKYIRWSRFFNIFSVDMWICFALSLVLAVITVRSISNYGHKSHLQESKSYSNISIITSNIVAILL